MQVQSLRGTGIRVGLQYTGALHRHLPTAIVAPALLRAGCRELGAVALLSLHIKARQPGSDLVEELSAETT